MDGNDARFLKPLALQMFNAKGNEFNTLDFGEKH